MVGPSLSEEELDVRRLRLKAAFVLMVAVSGAFTAHVNGATLVETGLVGLVALGLGVVLVLYLERIAPW